MYTRRQYDIQSVLIYFQHRSCVHGDELISLCERYSKLAVQLRTLSNIYDGAFRLSFSQKAPIQMFNRVLNTPLNYVFLAVKGATKFYFMHYSCMVIILLITDLYKSTFSTYSFKKLVFCFSVFCIFFLLCCELEISFVANSKSVFYNIFVTITDIGTKCSVFLFSPNVIMKS